MTNLPGTATELIDPRPRRFGRVAPPPAGAHAHPIGFPDVRFVGDEEVGLVTFMDRLPPRDTAAERPLRVLALSGGGAGGAFGAGALAGLSLSGSRPQFDMVTGVSTGALIAPFAFIGAAWDGRLRAAYTNGAAATLLTLRGLRAGGGLYGPEPLTNLVSSYVDEELLNAVAKVHVSGRRLFVATANLDSQSMTIWDLGAIAAKGGPAARSLFSDVLAASASLPGLFAPRLITVEAAGELYQEMHVDGGTIMPLFVVPEPLILRRARDWTSHGVEVYALVNTTLEPYARATPMGAMPILVRSFELMLRSSYRSALRSVAAFCEFNGFALHTASLPKRHSGASMLRFSGEHMAALFQEGAELAARGELWRPVTGQVLEAGAV